MSTKTQFNFNKNADGLDEGCLFLSWHEVLILWIGLVSVSSVTLLAVGQFVIPGAMLMGTVGTLLAMRALKVSFLIEIPRPHPIMVLVAFIGVVLRLEHWPNLTGGQDQGLYTNMSIALRRSGSLQFVDDFRQQLSPGMQVLYDRSELLSVSMVDTSRSIFTVDFYPLHPVWMAISQYFVGPYGRHLSLLGFSLLCIAGAYYLALEVDGRESVARLFASFVALNPALVFFTKFPVGEVVAAAFALNGFVFAIRAVRGETVTQRRVAGALATLCFLGLSLTRLQVVLYLPFLGLVGTLSVIPVLSLTLRRRLLWLVGMVLGTFAVSLVFYRLFQPALFSLMLKGLQEEVPAWPLLVVISIALVGGVLFLRRRFSEKGLWREKLRTGLPLNTNWWAPWLLLVVLAGSAFTLWELYQAGFMRPWNYPLPDGPSALIFRFHVLYRLFLFVSPVGLLLIIVAPWVWKRCSIELAFLCIFLSTLWIAVLTRPFAPYLYYYGRYLVVDVLPLSLLFVAIICVDLRHFSHRKLASFAAVAVLCWSALFSVLQLGKVEGEPNGTLEAFVETVSKNDILVLAEMDQRLVVPMRVSFERSVFLIDEMGEAESIMSELREIAQKQGGRLLWGSLGGDESPLSGFVAELPIDDCYLTNTDHFREDLQGLTPASKKSLLLPYSWGCNRNQYSVFDMTELNSGQSPLVAAAIKEGFFDEIELGSIILVGSIGRISGSYIELQEAGFVLSDSLPPTTIECEDSGVCSAQHRAIYVLRQILRPEGRSLLLAPVFQDLGHSKNPLIVLNEASVFGDSKALPVCDLQRPDAGLVLGIGEGWRKEDCIGSPALVSTYVEWFNFGCTSELQGWYICP